jgi:hypothetical protein
MTVYLERAGETVNRKRVQRLMAVMGLEALFPKPRTTTPAPGARVYPNLLRDRVLTHADEAWSSDITYVPMRHGFMYLTAEYPPRHRTRGGAVCPPAGSTAHQRDPASGCEWPLVRLFPPRRERGHSGKPPR